MDLHTVRAEGGRGIGWNKIGHWGLTMNQVILWQKTSQTACNNSPVNGEKGD
ncbi:hypothetical protein YKD1_25360 [Yersinia pseudotuberculosis]